MNSAWLTTSFSLPLIPVLPVLPVALVPLVLLVPPVLLVAAEATEEISPSAEDAAEMARDGGIMASDPHAHAAVRERGAVRVDAVGTTDRRGWRRRGPGRRSAVLPALVGLREARGTAARADVDREAR